MLARMPAHLFKNSEISQDYETSVKKKGLEVFAVWDLRLELGLDRNLILN